MALAHLQLIDRSILLYQAVQVVDVAYGSTESRDQGRVRINATVRVNSGSAYRVSLFSGPIEQLVPKLEYTFQCTPYRADAAVI